MPVELVYEKTCPNIEAARTQLLNAFSRAGLTPHWREWEVSSPSAPAHTGKMTRVNRFLTGP